MFSCRFHYSKRDYKKFASKPVNPISLPTNGYYYSEDYRYEYFNNGEDSLKNYSYHFLILFNNGRAKTDLIMSYPWGLKREYDLPPKRDESMAVAQKQFEERADRLGEFDDRNYDYTDLYRMYGDSIVITYYSPAPVDFGLFQLRGTKIGSGTFKMIEKINFSSPNPKRESINMIFHFKEYP